MHFCTYVWCFLCSMYLVVMTMLISRQYGVSMQQAQFINHLYKINTNFFHYLHKYLLCVFLFFYYYLFIYFLLNLFMVQTFPIHFFFCFSIIILCIVPKKGEGIPDSEVMQFRSSYIDIHIITILSGKLLTLPAYGMYTLSTMHVYIEQIDNT